MVLAKSKGYGDEPIVMEEIRQFLLFESNEIPSLPQSYAHKGGIESLWKLFSFIDDWTEIDHRLMHLLTKNRWGNPNKFIDKSYDDFTSEIFFEWYKKQLEQGNEPDYEKVEALLKKYEREDDLLEVLLSLESDINLVIDGKPTQLSERIIKRFKENPDEFFERIRKHSLNPVISMLIQFYK